MKQQQLEEAEVAAIRSSKQQSFRQPPKQNALGRLKKLWQPPKISTLAAAYSGRRGRMTLLGHSIYIESAIQLMKFQAYMYNSLYSAYSANKI